MAGPIKILHLTPYYPPHVGGLENHAGQLDRLLAGQGVSITVFTARVPRTAAAKESALPNLTILRYPVIEIIPHYPIPAFWHPAFWQLLKKTRAKKPTIIISRTRFFIASLLASLLAQATKTPHLHVEHGSDYPSLSNPLITAIAWLYDQTLGRYALRSADALVANSRASARFVQKLSGREASIIYRGIDKDAISNIPPGQSLVPSYELPAPVTITYAGRLIYGKGVADLLEALRSINYSLHPTPYTLLLIGSGPHEAELKQLAKKLGLTDIVTFLGEQDFTHTISLIKASDMFVHPSHTEGLPTSVIEAAVCKVAILATDVGGTPEIVTNETSAVLIPPKNPELLAQKLQELIQNPALRQRLAENAYQEVSQKFSWAEAVNQYQNLFDKLSH